MVSGKKIKSMLLCICVITKKDRFVLHLDCRSTYDMQPLVDEYPELERGSWDLPIFTSYFVAASLGGFSRLKA